MATGTCDGLLVEGMMPKKSNGNKFLNNDGEDIYHLSYVTLYLLKTAITIHTVKAPLFRRAERLVVLAPNVPFA